MEHKRSTKFNYQINIKDHTCFNIPCRLQCVFILKFKTYLNTCQYGKHGEDGGKKKFYFPL